MVVESWGALDDAIAARFLDEVEVKFDEGSLRKKVQYDNAPEFQQPEGERWCRMNLLAGESNQAEMGAVKTHRNLGVMMVQIFIPLGEGTKPATDLADFIKTKFRSLSFSGVVFRTPSRITVGRREGVYQLNVSCPFFADETA